MRKFLFAAGLLALCFSACKKQEVIVNTEPPKPPFRISGLSDITVERSPFFQSPILGQQYLSVRYEYGDQKRVTMSIADLPAGIRDSFQVRSGYPDFNTQLAFYDEGVQQGSYTPQLVLQTESDSVARRYPFSITIKGDTSCAGYFAGRTFAGTSSCSGTNPPVPYIASFVRPNTGSDTLTLNNFKGDGNGLKLVINCRNQSVSIPTQIVASNLVEGAGQLSNFNSNVPNVIFLTVLERDSVGNTTYCTYTFQSN